MDLDLTGETPESIDEVRLPAGWYLTKLEKAEEDGQDGSLALIFRVTSSPGSGTVLRQVLNNPAFATTTEEGAGQARKLNVWFKRLGLIGDQDCGKKVRVDARKAVGGQFVLQIEEKEVASKKTGNLFKISQIAYAGIYTVDRQEIPVQERLRMGLQLLEGQTATAKDPNEKQPSPRKNSAKKEPQPPATDRFAGRGFDPSEI